MPQNYGLVPFDGIQTENSMHPLFGACHWDINTAALPIIVWCNILVARCFRQLTGPQIEFFCHTESLTLCIA